MKVFAGSEAYKRLEGGIEEGVQAEERGVALTVAAVFRAESCARLDFSGTEHAEADRSELAREKREPQDERGWWLLEPGTYLVQLNEAILLPAGTIGFLSPHPRLLEGGASHPTLCLPGSRQPHAPVLPLSVAERGLALEENARISLLVVVG